MNGVESAVRVFLAANGREDSEQARKDLIIALAEDLDDVTVSVENRPLFGYATVANSGAVDVGPQSTNDWVTSTDWRTAAHQQDWHWRTHNS